MTRRLPLLALLCLMLAACAPASPEEGRQIPVLATPWQPPTATPLPPRPPRTLATLPTATRQPTATITQASATPPPAPTRQPTATSVQASATPPPAPTRQPIATVPVPVIASPTTGPLTCAPPPPEDYTRQSVGGHTLNARTLAMLERAAMRYQGPGDLFAITQGSYAPGLGASFGTHDGGGALDLSIRDPQTGAYLYEEVEAMVRALRLAGFAAWYRSPAEGFTPHIHAIAVGDAELSEAARAQIQGPNGYLAGGNALPDERAAPDPHGGPLPCPWMEAAR